MALTTARVGVASSAAAMAGVTQAAAAAMGVLTVWTTADGLLDVPQAEQIGVGIVTLLVALGLGLGSARTLTGRSSRLLVLAKVGSLVISAYWGLLRPPAEEFPVIPVAYAVLPVLGLGLLAVSAVRSRSRSARDPADHDIGPFLASRNAPDDAAHGRPPATRGHAEAFDQAAEGSAWA